MLVRLKAYRWFILGIVAVLLALGVGAQTGLISPDIGGGTSLAVRSAAQVTINIGSAVVGERNTTGGVTVPVWLSGASAQKITVDYTTADGSAVAGSDYTTKRGTLTFDPGQTAKVIEIIILNDALNEPDEQFVVSLSNPVNAVSGSPSSVAVVIQDDDPVPTLFINDVRVCEGYVNLGGPFGGGPPGVALGTGVPVVFMVTLSAASGRTVTVGYATADGASFPGAIAPYDYYSTSGTLVFSPGETTKNVTVIIIADGAPEGDETFLVNLLSFVNANIAKGQGVGTIRNPLYGGYGGVC